MEQVFNKLVRDNIPQIIESKREVPVTRVLNDDVINTADQKRLKRGGFEKRIFLKKKYFDK